MRKLKFTIYLLLNFWVLNAHLFAQDFYSKPTGDLNDLSTWGDQPNGTGNEPTNFTDPNVTYFIHNNNNATISGNWTVSGTDSKVIVGDGTDNISFTIPDNFTFDGVVDVENNGTLVLENASYPTIDNLETGSTVVYTGDATEILYRAYHHLVFEDIDPTFDGDDEIEIHGDFTLNGTVNMPDARDEDEYDILYVGSGNQTVSGNGNVVRAYSAEVKKTSGEFHVAPNTIFATDNQMKFEIQSPAEFHDNGNTLHAGNSFNADGDEAAYFLTGTLILDDDTPGIVKGAGNENNFNVRNDDNDNPVCEFNHIIVRAVNNDGQFRFRDGTSDVFKIKGDFIVEEQVEGAVRFYDNTVEIGGDFVVQPNFNGSFHNEIEHLIFNGNSTQNFTNGYPDLEVVALTIDNGNELILNDELVIEDEITFLSGVVVSSTTNPLRLEDFSGINGGSSSSYVNGTLSLGIDNTDASTLVFPVGDDEYRAVELAIEQQSADFTWYTTTVIDNAAPTHPIIAPLDNVSNVRHYEITQDIATGVEPMSLTLNYDTDDNVNDHVNLRIAHLENNEWVNFGGIGSAATSGSITNTENLETFGLFTLAETEPSTVPQIIVTPTNASFFNQTIGSPSSEQTFTVQGVNLEDDIEITAPAEFEISTTSGSGFNSTITLAESGGSVSSTNIYVRLNASSIGTYNGDLVFTSTDADNVEINLEGETFEDFQPGDDLIYYWHFNDMDPDGEDVTEIPADYSAIHGFIPTMEYTGSSNRDIDAYDPGSSINAQLGEPEGLAARVRNESDGRSLIFYFNTTGCENLIFEYAVHRSGSGMLENIIEYSIDGGDNYTQDFLAQTDFTITEDYELVSVDFSGITAVENNPNFLIRITYQGNTQQTNGNNRYDNITLKGDVENLNLAQNVKSSELKVYPNPFQNRVNIESENQISSVVVYDMLGNIVQIQSDLNSVTTDLDLSKLETGTYMIKTTDINNKVYNNRVIKK